MSSSPKISRRTSTLSSISTMTRSKSMWSLSDKGRRNTMNTDKAKLTQLLKTTQLEQLSKLQIKHQQECDLLDDIRNFGKQRSQLEKDYGLAMQKLVQQYQKKDGNTPDESEGNHITLVSAWKSVLEATEKASLARLASSESYKNGIYEAAKNLRVQKDANLKKCQDLLNKLQNEISDTVKDLTKAKKRYYELEQLATGAREKFKDVEERRKKNQPGIFKSKAGLEKTSQKLEQKCEECNKNSTIARNDYLLQLAAANAHQKRYYEVDMPECIRILDGDIYTKLQDYLSSTSRYEIEACSITQQSFIFSLQQSTKISREFSTRCFLRENPVFEWGPRYEFESSGDDPNQGQLTLEQGSADEDNSLNQDARKWASRFVRENKQIQRLVRLRQNLETTRRKYSENPDLALEATATELDSKHDKCIEDLRRIETSHLKCEARLGELRKADIDVDTWIQSAINQAAKEPNMSVPSTPVDPNKQFAQQGGNEEIVNSPHKISVADDSSFFDDDFDDTLDEAFEDDIENQQDDVSLTASDYSRTYPVSCKVLYGYTSTRSDELTITPDNVIEVVEDGDLEQWVKARDKDGRIGYVPENYLEFPLPCNSNLLGHDYSGSSHEKSPSTVSRNSNVVGGFLQSSSILENYAQSSVSGDSSTSGTSSLTTSSLGSMANHEEIDSAGSSLYAKAIYDYENCTDDEISFPEGAIIRILTKNDNGVDDGWWKGEFNGNIGVFPALVVEELTTTESDQNSNCQRTNIRTSLLTTVSPDTEAPPSFRPYKPNSIQAAAMSTASSSLPTTPVKQHRPTRLAPPPPQRPRSATTRATPTT